MLKKLQKKFVFFTTLISVIVMISIAITINIVNYTSMINKADLVLNMIADDDLKEKNNFRPRPQISKEIAYTTRFFEVIIDEDENVEKIDTKNISYISAQDAMDYVDKTNKSSSDNGTIDEFRYIVIEENDRKTYIFLDIEQELLNFYNYLFYSVIVLFIALILIFILSIVFSKKVVSPIAQSHQRQKQFITDVSHEFKTPLAIINADCDVIEIDNGETEWTDSIKNQVDRLNNLVENLISLTRLDEDSVKLNKENFSLTDTVKRVTNNFSPTIYSNNLTIDGDVTDNMIIYGDEKAIYNLLSVLTENAIKYTTSGGTIFVSLYEKNKKVIFTIENPCDSIEIGTHNNWFERFYREDDSRNSESKSFGIGLSIAKAICDKHNAKISAESKTGNEIVFTIVFKIE